MKRILIGCCAALAGAALLAGCASRSLNAVSEESSAPSSSVAEVEPEEPSSSEASSAAPEKKYPLPEMSGVDRMMLEDDAAEFVKYFGQPQDKIAADELDTKKMLAFCLSQINREKTVQGYFFDKSEDGLELVPADLVGEMAERMFGVSDFAPTDASSYKEAQNCYLYKASDGFAEPDCTLSELLGTEEGGIARDATFDGGTVRYSFSMLRRNGMPYLQLVEISPQP